MKKSFKCVNIKRAEAEDFKRFLRFENIYFEPSENGNLIHFEVLVDEDEEESVNDYLENPAYYWSDERYYYLSGCPWDA